MALVPHVTQQTWGSESWRLLPTMQATECFKDSCTHACINLSSSLSWDMTDGEINEMIFLGFKAFTPVGERRNFHKDFISNRIWTGKSTNQDTGPIIFFKYLNDCINERIRLWVGVITEIMGFQKNTNYFCWHASHFPLLSQNTWGWVICTERRFI